MGSERNARIHACTEGSLPEAQKGEGKQPQLGSPRGQLWTDPPTPTAAARCLCLTSACCLCLTPLSNSFLFQYLDDWAGSTPSYGEDRLQEFVLCEKESDKMMCSRYLILACKCWWSSSKEQGE